jgi:hypothetical protein
MTHPFEITPPEIPGLEPAPAPVPIVSEAEAVTARPGRPHLVVVTTREAHAGDPAPEGAILVTRFWHPRDHRWSENFFESLEHALRLFVDESGWTLIQQQELDTPLSHELIFEARREDFSGPTTEEILRDVGLTPE